MQRVPWKSQKKSGSFLNCFFFQLEGHGGFSSSFHSNPPGFFSLPGRTTKLSVGHGGSSNGGGRRESQWWMVDAEMHEIGDDVPPRERFVIPRDNISIKKRKFLREQYMRRTRLVMKESEHEQWCKRYMELYQELRENWERLYWDEGYSKKIAQDHSNYESEEDEADFPQNRGWHRGPNQMQQGAFGDHRQNGSFRPGQIRDKFEHDREKRMREKAFAPYRGNGVEYGREFCDQPRSMNVDRKKHRPQPFEADKYYPRYMG